MLVNASIRSILALHFIVSKLCDMKLLVPLKKFIYFGLVSVYTQTIPFGAHRSLQHSKFDGLFLFHALSVLTLSATTHATSHLRFFLSENTSREPMVWKILPALRYIKMYLFLLCSGREAFFIHGENV